MIGFFGLTANPPHFSHCYAIREALKRCDKVYVSLVYQHPFGKKFIAYENRKDMFCLICDEYFIPEEKKRIFLNEIDKDYLDKTGKIPYSYDLLCYLKLQEPTENFKLIIGEDNYQPETWKRFFANEKIESEFGLIIVPDRPVHSTHIREKMLSPLENKQYIQEACGKEVYQYMVEHQLY